LFEKYDIWLNGGRRLPIMKHAQRKWSSAAANQNRHDECLARFIFFKDINPSDEIL